MGTATANREAETEDEKERARERERERENVALCGKSFHFNLSTGLGPSLPHIKDSKTLHLFQTEIKSATWCSSFIHSSQVVSTCTTISQMILLFHTKMTYYSLCSCGDILHLLLG
jgi:hypothetical protein